MATYESFSSNSASGNTVVINKPTGLAVGDLMVAQITAHRNNGGTSSLNTPAGWSLLRNIIDSSTYNPMSVYYKTADSADVSASNFTFTSTGGSTPYILGHLIRLSDFGIFAGDSGNSSDTSSSTVTNAGFTPTLPNCTYIFFGVNSSNVNVGTLTTYAIATDNPTWTEISEIGFNSANYDTQLAFATATRSAITATGTVTLTKSNADSSNGFGLILAALAPRVDGSTTVTTGETFIVNHPFLRNGVTEINGVNPDIDSANVTQWTNPDKPSSTWTNPAK